MHRQRRIERRLSVPVGDQLHRDQQAAAANIADIGMVAEPLEFEKAHQPLTGLLGRI